jgi:hypothetical protein
MVSRMSAIALVVPAVGMADEAKHHGLHCVGGI